VLEMNNVFWYLQRNWHVQSEN